LEESGSLLFFHYLLTDSPTKPPETGESSELPDEKNEKAHVVSISLSYTGVCVQDLGLPG